MVVRYALLTAALAAAVGFLAYNYVEAKRLAEFKSARAQAMANLQSLHGDYKKRGEILAKWSTGLAKKEREEIRVLLSENSGLNLAEAIEMQRFDFVQERLNFMVGKAKAPPKDLKDLDRQIELRRRSYASEALKLNHTLCARCRGLELPVFPAEAALNR